MTEKLDRQNRAKGAIAEAFERNCVQLASTKQPRHYCLFGLER